MHVKAAVSESLGLLDRRDRRKLIGIAVLQAFAGFLDLAGILLIGIIGALAVAGAQGQPLPPSIEAGLALIDAQGASDAQVIATLALIAAGLLLVKSAVSAFLVRRTFLFLAQRQAEVTTELTRRLLIRPLTFLQSSSSQEVAYALIQGAGAATLGILGQGVILASEAFLLIIVGTLLIIVNPAVAIGSIIFFGLVAVFLQLLLGKRALRSGRAVAQSEVASLDAIQEALGAYRELSVTGRRTFYLERIQHLRWDASRAEADLQFISALPKYVYEVSLVFGGFILVGVLLNVQGQGIVTAVGTLALFVAAATRVMPSILRLQGASLTIRNVAGSAQKTLALAERLDASPVSLDSALEARLGTGRQRHGEFIPLIVAHEVTYSYPGSLVCAVQDVSLSVPAGHSLAIVGPSGAGKSTLADLVLGVLRPTKGQVLIGGLEPEQAIVHWPDAIAYVPQEVMIANATIRDNVALGIPEDMIDDDAVWQALRRAHLADFVLSQPQHLKQLVGERGARLSGGQRQRLGLARALYGSPRLLVLDEATSALDAQTEDDIAVTLRELHGDVTTIVIAHRLSTVRKSDQVLYIERGRLISRGTFDEVRMRVPEFDRQAGLMGLIHSDASPEDG